MKRKEINFSRKCASIFRPISLSHFFILFYFLTSCNQKEEPPGFAVPKSFTPDLPEYLQNYFQQPADNPTTEEGILLGKSLFFEKALSADYSTSCASCHRPEFGFGDNQVFSKGIGRQLGNRNTPSLLNAGLLKRMFWDGRDSTLETQSLHPIIDPTEMGLTLTEAVKRLQGIPQYADLFGRAFGDKTITSDRLAKALAQFERSLISGNSKYDLFLQGKYNPNQEELLGMQLFFTHPDPFAPGGGIRGGNCGDCHLPQTLLGDLNRFDGFHNTGLLRSESQERGLQNFTGKLSDFGRFKTPGLRNVVFTAPYMHDGRFQTLEQVLDHYNSDTLFQKPNLDVLLSKGTNEKFGTSLGLTNAEKTAIIRFLHMLTDSAALQAP
jgi:cytochrome c peroxidase